MQSKSLFGILGLVIGVALVAQLLTRCSSSSASRAASSPEYLATCHGQPLRTIQARSQAQEDGYDINQRHDCITRESHERVAKAKADWEAANTPEAKAKREAEFAAARERSQAEALARSQQQAASDTARAALGPATVPVPPTDVNTASEAELAAVVTIGPKLAAALVAERNKAKFRDWADLVGRVVALSAAQTAAYASVCGLTVNGQSLSGAPPDGRYAALLKERYAQYPDR